MEGYNYESLGSLDIYFRTYQPFGGSIFFVDWCGCDQEIYWCWLWSLAELLGGAMAAGVFRLLRREEFAQAKQNGSNP